MRLRASCGGDGYSTGLCARISSPLRQTGALLLPRPVEATTCVSPPGKIQAWIFSQGKVLRTSPSISPAVLLMTGRTANRNANGVEAPTDIWPLDLSGTGQRERKGGSRQDFRGPRARQVPENSNQSRPRAD